MKLRPAFVAGLSLLASACGARDRAAPGKPLASSKVIRPDKVTSFAMLYAANCAACHGVEGKGGAAQPLRDPLYLAIASDATIRDVARNGVHGTAMPAFVQNAGGMLTDEQIDAIVTGIRKWEDPEAVRGANPPPYAANTAGDTRRGANVYAVYCASCHGPDGRGGKRGSSIVDASFLALVSDQSLRTTVIVGRPDLGAPDFRENVPGKPMTNQEVTDVVAWLAAQRAAFAGQPYPAASKRTELGVRP